MTFCLADAESMRLLATRLDDAAREITRLQGGSVSVGLPITAPAELAHYELPLRNLVEWCHSSAADLRRRAAVAAQADLIDHVPFHEALKTAAAGGVDAELTAFDALGADGDVAGFFAGLAPGRGLAVALARAAEVGGRAGVPLELRFAANQQLVRLARAEAIRSGDQAAADRYAELLNPERQLLYFDARGTGLIAEALGDLTAAKSVAIMVPGTGNSLANYHAGPEGDFRRFHKAVSRLSGTPTATIMWIGSELPPNLGVAMLTSYAERAAPKLREFAEGLDLGPDVRTTLIGHSYGSVVTGHAVRAGLHPDNLVAVASPGWGVDDATELDAPETHLWAMRHDGDVIKLLAPVDGLIPPIPVAGHGNDPIYLQGVRRLPSGGESMLGVDKHAHSDYFGNSATSQTATTNIARVVAGQVG
ncbi:alpha/beta hydrolase [Herbidospora sp. RD11066]